MMTNTPTDKDILLSEHRITKVELIHFRQIYPRLLGKNAIRSYHGYGGTIDAARIYTDQGAVGWGAIGRSEENARNTVSLVEGRRLSDVFSCDEGILDQRLVVFDIPLHDLAGQILGISVAKMIDPGASSSVRVYDGAIYMNDIIPESSPWGIKRILDDCAYDLSLGHNALKIKIGRSKMWMEHDTGLQRDIDLVNQIHNSFPDATIMVDANDGYSIEDAIAFLRGVKNVPLYWFEEPMRESETDFRILKDYMRIERPMTMIADGESNTDVPLLFDLAGKGLLDVWNPDIYYMGFSQWRKLLKKITALGYLASPHAWDCVLKTYYCAHLAAAYPNHIPTIETVIGRCEGVDESRYKITNGTIHVPDAPGFGLSLEYAALINEPLYTPLR